MKKQTYDLEERLLKKKMNIEPRVVEWEKMKKQRSEVGGQRFLLVTRYSLLVAGYAFQVSS